MWYTNMMQALVRANSDKLIRVKFMPLRLQSTGASNRPQEKVEEGQTEYPLVEKPCMVDLMSHMKRHGDKHGSIFIDFENTQEAYKSKNTMELLRSLLVFKLCTFDFLVDRNKELMDLSRRILGQRLFEKLMKMTFYGQFVAGEDQDSIKPLIQKNQAFGVGSVLDYSVEEDLTQEEAEKKEMDSCLSQAEKDSNAGSSVDGFSAIKMTALGRPQFLLQFSEVLIKWRRFFSLLAAQQGQDGMNVLEQKLELEQLQETLAKLGVASRNDIENWLTGEKLGSSGTIDLLDWNSIINDRTKISNLLVVPNMKTGHLEPLLSRFTDEEERQMKRMLQRMDTLAKHAVANGVRLMVDAEQTYFQPAISRLTLEMQRIFNLHKPIIFNTYQCYLQEAYDNVTMDVELSRREGWYFGAKLVRGAYMHQERQRAAEIGYMDPINPDYKSTNRMYHRCLEYVLEEIYHNRVANVMVASHNEDTVKFTLEKMNEMGLSPKENMVYFGQLLGMCDQISFPLGQAGFPVYKYVPYGPVKEVIPYLSRRAQENCGFMKGSQRERHLLWKEIQRRIRHGQLLYKPVY